MTCVSFRETGVLLSGFPHRPVSGHGSCHPMGFRYMESMWKAGLVFIISLAAGFVIAKSGRNEAVATGESPDRTRHPANSNRERWQREDFLGSLKSARETKWEPLFAAEFKDWTTEEIESALNEGLGVPERVIPSSRASEMMGTLLREWVRRDLDGALAWFEKLPFEGLRNEFGSCLAASWPKERAEEGLAYVFTHPRLFDSKGGTSSGFIIQIAIESAAEKGPAAVAEVLVRVKEHHLTPRYAEGWRFPAGFDFAKLAASPAARELGQGYAFFAGVWMSCNREEAFRDLVASGDGKVSMENLFADVMPHNGAINHQAATERAKWIAGKMGGIESGRQGVLAEQAVETFVDSPDTLAAFTTALSNEEVRQAVSSKALKALAQKSMETAMAYLEATESPDRRLAALEALETDSYRRWRQNKEWERRVREKLASWNAGSERRDAIVKHLKEVKQ